MIQVADHKVEGSEMVGHLCTFQQRTTYRNHGHTLFSKNPSIIDSKRVSLNSTRVRREQNLVIFHPLLLPHPIGYLLLIFLSDALVFFYLFLKHRCKDSKNQEKRKEKYVFSFISSHTVPGTDVVMGTVPGYN